MGNYCGGDRKQLEISKSFMMNYEQNQSQYQKNSSNFQSRQIINLDAVDSMHKNCDQKNPLFSLYNQILQAKDNEDLNLLIDNIDNDQKLMLQIDIGHPWASSPNSIGSLSTMFLCTFFIKSLNSSCTSEQNDEQAIQKYFQAFNLYNAYPKITQNLKSKEIDKQELTVLLLVFIAEHDELLEFQQKDMIFQSLIKLFDFNLNKKKNFMSACCYILKELFKNSESLTQLFIESQFSMDSLKCFAESDNIQYNFEALECIECLLKENKFESKINIQYFKILFQKQFLKPLLKIQMKIIQNNTNELNIDEIEFETLQYQKNFINQLIQKIRFFGAN